MPKHTSKIERVLRKILAAQMSFRGFLAISRFCICAWLKIAQRMRLLSILRFLPRRLSDVGFPY